jgi:hypothetical protein
MTKRVILWAAPLIVSAALLYAQAQQAAAPNADAARAAAPAPGGFMFGRGGGGWLAPRGDAQRTAWIKEDALLSPEAIARPGFELQWKHKLENAQHRVGLLTGVVSGNGGGLNPAPVVIADSSNNVYGIEVDTGASVWLRHFEGPSLGGSPSCPGGLTAAPVRSTTPTQSATGSAGARGMGRGPYLSGVGKPGQGVPPELMEGGMGGPGSGGRGPGGFGGPSGPGAPGGPGRGPAPPPGFGGGGRGGVQTAYVITSDGTVHTLGVHEGKETKKTVRFLPPNANVSDVIAINDFLYASTTNSCGGAPNGVWSIDLASEAPSANEWKAGSSPVAGFAFSHAGTAYVTTGDRLVALNAKTLAEKESHIPAGAAFAAGPIVFTWQEHELVAAPARDGRIFVFSADQQAPLAISSATNTSKTWSPQGLATWEDEDHNRYIVEPAMSGKGTIVTFKLTGDASKPELQQVWTAGDLGTPSAPIIVNGVVFALKTGTSASPAVLYAFNGTSGTELWNSGKTITSYVQSTPIWSSNAQVYVATHDGTLYAFGFAMDRHL